MEAMADLESGIEMGIVVHQPRLAQLEQWRAVTADVTGILVESTGGRSAEILQIIEAGKKEFAISQVVD